MVTMSQRQGKCGIQSQNGVILAQACLHLPSDLCASLQDVSPASCPLDQSTRCSTPCQGPSGSGTDIVGLATVPEAASHGCPTWAACSHGCPQLTWLPKLPTLYKALYPSSRSHSERRADPSRLACIAELSGLHFVGWMQQYMDCI